MGARSIPNELDLLKETVTTLIANVESLKKKNWRRGAGRPEEIIK
jgi:hypothetical protein